MKDYRKLKKYWRTILKKETKINYTSLRQFPLFQRKYVTESDVLDYLLSIDKHLRESYEVYQELLAALETITSIGVSGTPVPFNELKMFIA